MTNGARSINARVSKNLVNQTKCDIETFHSKSGVRVSAFKRKMHIVFPRIWLPEHVNDYNVIDIMIDHLEPDAMFLDLKATQILNMATMWIIDKLHWKCVQSQLSFNIDGSSNVIRSYFCALTSINFTEYPGDQEALP